jgi:hypothetical protein
MSYLKNPKGFSLSENAEKEEVYLFPWNIP